jgi:hypothetical protein
MVMKVKRMETTGYEARRGGRGVYGDSLSFKSGDLSRASYQE